MSGEGLVLRGRWTIADPAAPAGAIADGAVLIEGERVAFVGGFEEALARAPGAEVIGDGTGLVIPGLINTHHHGRGLTALQLGVTDDRLEPWLLDWRGMKPLDAYLDTLYAATRLLRGGVTTVLHSGVARDLGRYAEDTRAHLRAYEDAGIRVSYGLQTLDRRSFTDEDDERFLARLPVKVRAQVTEAAAEMGPPGPADFETLLEELLATYAGHPRIKVMASPVGPNWCTDDLLLRAAAMVREAGSGLHLHCLESPFQRHPLTAEGHGGAVERLEALGLLGADVSLAHGVWLSPLQTAKCAHHGTTICHNPSSNLRLRSGVMPLGEYLAAGVNVSLGTDGITVGDDEDMLAEMRLAANLHRAPDGVEEAWVPSSAEVLAMATVNAGRPTLWGKEIGRLAEGGLADAVLIDYDAVAGIYIEPGVDPLDALLYRARERDVRTVVVGGRPVYRDGRFETVEEAELASRLRAVAEQELEPRLRRWKEAMEAVRPYVVRRCEELEAAAADRTRAA